MPELLAGRVGPELDPEAVRTLLTYRSLSSRSEFDLEALTVVLASPCQPEELQALNLLKEAGLLALTVLLERGGPGRWGGVFGKKPTSLTASYLGELGYDDTGWLEWEEGDKATSRLCHLLTEAEAEPNGFLVVYCQDEGEPSIEGLSPLSPGVRASRYVSQVFSEVKTGNTVFARFAEFLKTEVRRRELFAVRESELEDVTQLRSRLSLFREMAEADERSPVLVVASAALPCLYDLIRQWCDAPSSRRLTLMVHRSGLPPQGRDSAGGLTDVGLLLSIPHLRVAIPADESQAQSLFAEIRGLRGPSAIVFTSAPAVGMGSQAAPGAGQGRVLREGSDASILALGSTVYPALLAAESLQTMGLSVGVYDLRYRRPVDRELVEKALSGVRLAVAVDEHPEAGSFAGLLYTGGEGGAGLLRLNIEVEDAEKVLAAAPGEMLTLEHFGLHAEGISKAIKSSMRLAPPTAFG